MTLVTIGDATLYRGEALEMLQQLPEGLADAVITDPPYSSGGAFRGDRAMDTKAKYLSSDSGNRAKTQDFGGDNRDQRSFHFWSTLWSSAALRASKPGAPALFFSDWRQLPISTDYLQAGGWVWRGVVPWAKKASRPQMGRFSAACEYVVWGSAGPMPLERDVGCLPGFYEFAYPSDREHITQKPVDLMEAMVEICPGGGGSCSIRSLVAGPRESPRCEWAAGSSGASRAPNTSTSRAGGSKRPTLSAGSSGRYRLLSS